MPGFIRPTNVFTEILDILMIDYRLLAALSAVIEQGGFERAAQHLHLTQSAVSQRIRQLEQQMGQPVLKRSLPPQPTLLGQRLNNHYQQVRQMEADLALPMEQPELLQRLRLTTNADSLATWLPTALAQLDVPGRLEYELLVADQDVGLEDMKRGEVMACLCSSAQPVNGGRASFLGYMRYRALLSPQLLTRCKQPLNAESLQQLPCLIFSRNDRLQHRFLQQFMGVAEPLQVHYCPSSEGFMQMALAGLGFGMMPELQVQHWLQQGRLVDLLPGCYLDIPLYWHYWQSESQLLKRLRAAVETEAARSLLQKKN